MLRILTLVLVVALLLTGFIMAAAASYRGISALPVGPGHPGESVRDQSIFGPWFMGRGPGTGK